MQNIIDKMAEWSDRLSQTFFLRTIMGGFIIILPLTMIGSIAALINAITIAPIQGFLVSSGISSILTAVNQYTTGSIAVYLAYSMANSATNTLGHKKDAIAAGVASLASFFVITPYEPGQYGGGTISMDWFGAQGMFSAIVCGLITGLVFHLCIKHNVTIRLPKQVPPMVADQFKAIIPAFFTVVIFAIVKYGMGLTPFGNFHSLIYTIIGMPLNGLGSSIFGLWIMMLATALLWFCGIHGGMIVMNLMTLVFTPLQLENLTAYTNGAPLPNMLDGQVLSVGTGSLVFLVVMLVLAKSKTARSVSELAIVPSFFGIDEPAYFGLPMIMNPIFFIPWVIISPTLTVFGSYFLTLAGLLPVANGASIGYNLPFFVNNFIVFGWQGVVWGFVFFAINVLICIPFVKAYDKQMKKREAEEETAAAEAEEA